jgi:hypothetical protein
MASASAWPGAYRSQVIGVLKDLLLGRTALVRIAVFRHFALSLSLKIVWAARSDQVQLPSVGDDEKHYGPLLKY